MRLLKHAALGIAIVVVAFVVIVGAGISSYFYFHNHNPSGKSIASSISPDGHYQVCAFPKYSWSDFIAAMPGQGGVYSKPAIIILRDKRSGKILDRGEIDPLNEFDETSSVTWYSNYVRVKFVQDWKLPTPIKGLKEYKAITLIN